MDGALSTCNHTVVKINILLTFNYSYFDLANYFPNLELLCDINTEV